MDAIRRMVSALRESAQVAEKTLGISAAQLFALQKIGENTPVSVNELAALTYTHQSTVSVVARRLEERGLVSSARSAEDGRRAVLSPTEAGNDLIRRAPDTPQRRMIAGLNRLSPAVRQRLGRSMEQLLDAMEVVDPEPPMLFEDDARPRPRRGKPPGRGRK